VATSLEHVFESVALSDVHEARTTVDALTRRLRPEEVPAGEVAAMWEAFAAIERQASAAKTLLAARVAELHTGPGAPEEELARKAGTSTRAARRAIATSRHLKSLPGVEAALRRGDLSPDQADAVADAAAVNPGAESSLVDTARTASLKQLRDAAVRAKAAGDPYPDATHARIHRERYVRRWTDADGAWCLRARGTADAGAVVNAVLEPLIDEIFRTARREGRPESRDSYTFDALLALARGATITPTVPATEPATTCGPGARTGTAGSTEPAQVDQPGSADRPLCVDQPSSAEPPGADHAGSGEPGSGPPPGGLATTAVLPTPGPGMNPRFLSLLRIDLAALTRGGVERDEVCEIAGVGPVPARVARALLGDSIVKLVITRGVDVVNVTNLGRGPTAAQRVALLWATPGCTNSECDHTLAIQHDHRVPWADDQVTELHNLDRLCPTPCHHRKTHDGWALVLGTGRRPLVPPDDPRHPANTTTGTPPPAAARHAARDATLLDNHAA